MAKLVSVVLTLYKIDKKYIEECIDSLLAQTYDNVEILCMDDCSPDFDYSYLQQRSDKIRYYRNEVNLGMNKTVNKAFELVKGEYIVRLGSDDIFDEQMIEKEVTFLDQNPEYGAVCCELKRFGSQDQRITRPNHWNYKEIVENRRYGGTGYAGGMMFRKELLAHCSIDESLKMCEDLDFHLQMLRYMPIGSLHEVLYHYRSHETNLCKQISKEERWACLDRIIAKHEKYLKNKN